MSCPRGAASPNQHTKLRLFADSGGYCQRPDCERPLFIDTEMANIHIAEIAHVFSANDRGPRANQKLSKAERGHYDNLILLCPSCHTTIDKAPDDFTDETVLDWKRNHVERIAALFGAVEYSCRRDARAAIEPILAENAMIFEEYGPDNDYRYDPESDFADVWKRKMLAHIIPNNRTTLAILDANRCHLSASERTTVEHLRQHIDDLEARHLGDGVASVGRRYPPEMKSILEEHSA